MHLNRQSPARGAHSQRAKTNIDMISCYDRRRIKVFNIVVMIVWSSHLSYADGSCASKGDIVFLLDESGSIGSSNFERIKSFVSTIVGQFSVGNDTNQFSVVNFESSAREIFPLNRYQTVSSIQSAISIISFSSGGTSIGSALNYARMYSFTTTRGARLDGAKIAVLITDGQSSLSDEPERLKAMGVTIFCVGVGTGVNSAVLRSVATHNDYTYLTTFDVLNLIAEELSNRTCADDINDCLGEPCLNGGTCEDQFGKYVCHCQGGNTDPNCYLPGLPNVTLGSSVLVYSGSTATLNCYVTSLTTVSSIIWLYQKNGVTSVINTGDTSKYSGGTVGTPSLSVKNVQVTDVGNYRCQAQNTAGIGQSEQMIYLDLRQGYPSVVTTRSYAVNASSNVTLTCNFTSSYPPVQMMQWYKYDSDITTGLTGKYIGGTLQNPSLTITDFQPDDQAIYKCSASNSYGTRNSSDIVVYLHVDGGAPVILTGQNMTGSSGTTLIIPCTVVGGSISRVFWTFQPSDQDNETEIVFSYSKLYWYSSSPSLRIYYLNTSDIGFYRCCANSSSGLGRSTPVYVTLRGKKINVDIYTYSVYTGDDVMLSVSIFSMPDAINITWMFSTIYYYSYYYYAALDLTSDVRYDGGAVLSPSLVIRNVTASDGGYYILRLTNVDGTIYSSRITLSVQKSLPVITTEQQYFYDVYTESTVNFELNVTSNLPVLSVTWEKSVVSYFYYASTVNITDDRIFGGTIDDPSLTIGNISLADTSYYRFTATNADGSRSVVFYLSVNLHPPTIYLSTTSYTVYTGSNVTLDVNVTSTPSLTEIIWERRNTSTFLYSAVEMADNRVEGGDISVPSLTILDVEVSDKTYYRMRATNRDGTTISSLIYLYVNTRPPVVSVGKTSLTAATKASISLQVNYTSGPEMKSVSWEKGSSFYSFLYVSMNITTNSRFTGGTIDSPSLNINDLKLEDSGYYRCRVTNDDGTTTTPVFTVLVQKQLANVNVAATTYTVSFGNNATLYVTITNSESNSTITWERKGQNEANYNVINTQTNVKYGGGTLVSPSLTIYNITEADVGYYRCKVTNIDGTTTSSLIYIGLKSPDDSSCDKLSCGGLRECVLMNNKPTCSVSTWKAAAVAVAVTVGAAASVAAGVVALKSLTSKAIQPLNGNSQGSNSNSNNRNNRNNNDNNDHNSDNNSDDNNSDDDISDRESNHNDDMPDPNYIGGFQGVINSMPPPNM
ncbi:immunoglobulin superfamily member 10 isoform X1 [Magallana gigas]|uniref:immunoglobulin superfamily member 10 isoform X1 n=1 Tax=Magallana gigas TaxID=29159 RepID=UPI0033429D7F